jgi:hypothetical protein
MPTGNRPAERFPDDRFAGHLTDALMSAMVRKRERGRTTIFACCQTCSGRIDQHQVQGGGTGERLFAMTELGRTPPRLQRLFRLIDLAPLPRHEVVVEALKLWREKRGSGLAPSPADIFGPAKHATLDHSFLAEPMTGAKDFAISEAGSQAVHLLGLEHGARRLSEAGKRRIAARLRPFFSFVIDYGEPVLARFVDRGRSFEVLAAPIETAEEAAGAFCTLAFDELPGARPGR